MKERALAILEAFTERSFHELSRLVERLRNGAAERAPTSVRQLTERAELLARHVLGVSADEAFEMLDRGELDGTAIEVELSMLRYLIGDDADAATRQRAEPESRARASVNP